MCARHDDDPEYHYAMRDRDVAAERYAFDRSEYDG